MRRFISVALIITLCVAYSVPSYAGVSKAEETQFIKEEIQQEIDSRVEVAMECVYEQLEEQGKLYFLDDFRELVEDEIEHDVLLERAPVYVKASTPTRTFKYGGTVANVTASGKNAVITYLDYDNSYYYILNGANSIIAADIIECIASSLPQFGAVFTALFFFRTLATKTAYNSITAAKGYAKIMTIKDPVTRDYSSVLSGWDTYPTAGPYAYKSGFKAEAFPKHNPFND